MLTNTQNNNQIIKSKAREREYTHLMLVAEFTWDREIERETERNVEEEFKSGFYRIYLGAVKW